MRRLTLVALVSAVVLAPPSWAAGMAVLAVVSRPGESADAIAMANKARSLLGADTVDDATLRSRLRGPVGVPLDLASVKATLAAAEDAFSALEHERSVSLLETAIGQLSNDRDFSVEKRALLEQARLQCAQRLVGLAGPAETGRAETKNGARARMHLAELLRQNPSLTLDANRYPPKLRALLALAGDDVKAKGMGGLKVTSAPEGATVFLDGRSLGLTPLIVHDAVPAGRYRLWVEQGEQRSMARVIDVAAGADVPIEIDLGFEAALRPDDVAIGPPRPFSPADWRRLAGFLDVESIGLVGSASVDGSTAFWVGVIGSDGSLQRGATLPSDATIDAIVGILQGTAGVDPAFVAPSAIVAPPVTSPPLVAQDEGPPWTIIGIGAGVGVAAVVATTVAIVVATRTVTEQFTVHIEERR